MYMFLVKYLLQDGFFLFLALLKRTVYFTHTARGKGKQTAESRRAGSVTEECVYTQTSQAAPGSLCVSVCADNW